MSLHYADIRNGEVGVEHLPDVLTPPDSPLVYVRDDDGDRHDYVGGGDNLVTSVDRDGVPTHLRVNDCMFDAHEDVSRARETVDRADHVALAFPGDEAGDVFSADRAAQLYADTAHEKGRTLHALYLLPVPSVEDSLIEFHQFALVDEIGDGSPSGFRSYRASGHAPKEFFRGRVRDRAKHSIGGPSAEMTQLLREVEEFAREGADGER